MIQNDNLSPILLMQEELNYAFDMAKEIVLDETISRESRLDILLHFFYCNKVLLEFSQKTYRDLEKILNEEFPQFNSPELIQPTYILD